MRVPVGTVFSLGPLRFQFVPLFFTAANSTVVAAHKIDSDAVGWIQVSIDKYAKLRDGPVSNTRSSVALQCDTAATKAVVLLVGVKLSER